MRTTNGIVGSVTLDAKTTMLLARGGKTTTLSVLVDRIGNPVDTRIISDARVVWIDKDDLKILVGGILVNPVRVQDSQVCSNTTNTLLSNAA